eukprot:Anaeramoba_ignava/c18518_g1_i1.p1 GENE.c18518_g1_i1~~c18518_g1_i1.p1  ORF type:complete len:168 (+),score=43.80 c18518_g1_i1:244-747(+)
MSSIYNAFQKFKRNKGIPTSSTIHVMGGKEYKPDTKEQTKQQNKSKKQLHLLIWKDFYSDFNSKIWISYRKNFESLSGHTSDSGWGCMYRTGQMILANTLSVLFLGRNFRLQEATDEQNKIFHRIISFFADEKEAPYSIHKISELGVEMGMQISEWYSPTMIVQIIK